MGKINDQIKLHVSKQSEEEMKSERKYIVVVGIERKEFTWHFEEQGVWNRKKYKIEDWTQVEKCGGRVGVVREEWCLYFILYYIYILFYST